MGSLGQKVLLIIFLVHNEHLQRPLLILYFLPFNTLQMIVSQD